MIKPMRVKWMEHVARMGEKMKGYRLLVGKKEGRRPSWRDSHGLLRSAQIQGLILKCEK
jgi:hypothetical protein